MKKRNIIMITLIIISLFLSSFIIFQYKYIDVQVNKYIKNNKEKLELFDNRIYIVDALKEGKSHLKYNVFYKKLNIYSSYYVVNKKGRSVIEKNLYYSNKKYIKNDKLLYDVIPNKYTGLEADNYLWFNQILWRIVSKDKSGIKIVSEVPITSISWGNDLSYEKSYIHKWLNNDFLSNIEDKSIIKNKDEDKVSLLTIDDYNKSLSKKKTYINAFDNNYYLLDNNKEALMYDVDLGKITSANKKSSLAIRPVIILNKNVKLRYGKGTKKDYFVIEKFDTKEEELSNKKIGSYVVFSDKLWRVIDFDEKGNIKLKINYFDSRKTFYAFDTEDKTKRCVGIESFNEEDITGCNSDFNSNVKNPPLYKKHDVYHAGGNNIAYYLNSKDDKDSFYNKLKDKKWTVDHKWNLGTYKIGEDYNSTLVGKTANEKIGLIRIGEMFSSNDDGFYYFTLNSYNDKRINYIDFYGQITNDYTSIPIGVRPCLYLNNKVFVYDGNGTIEKPYLLRERR